MSDSPKPYQECVEGCMFIIMGRLYNTKYDSLNIEIIQEIEDLSDAHKTEEVFKDAVDSLFHEGFITGEDASTQLGKNIYNLLMTQKGREWYQEQIESNKPKWKKYLKYVSIQVHNKLINII